jgi:hypothetical protein
MADGGDRIFMIGTMMTGVIGAMAVGPWGDIRTVSAVEHSVAMAMEWPARVDSTASSAVDTSMVDTLAVDTAAAIAERPTTQTRQVEVRINLSLKG